MMKTITATEAKNKLGLYMRKAEGEPVLVEVAKRPTVVLLSYGEFARLKKLEDEYWNKRAREAVKSGYIGSEESIKLLMEAMKKKDEKT
jgi:prevent-host-death family protein